MRALKRRGSCIYLWRWITYFHERFRKNPSFRRKYNYIDLNQTSEWEIREKFICFYLSWVFNEAERLRGKGRWWARRGWAGVAQDHLSWRHRWFFGAKLNIDSVFWVVAGPFLEFSSRTQNRRSLSAETCRKVPLWILVSNTYSAPPHHG